MEEQILKQLAQPLLAWYDIHRRILPWREEVSPYRTWVSEIMLQQTRVAAVLPYFQRFMEAFPTVEALAQADTERLMKLWEGLGYYSRARNLQKAARILTEQYGGRFPETYRELTALPGIGDYTAGAILSIAFGQAVPAVDGNVLRLAARITGSRLDVLDAKNRKIFRSWMAAAMSQERPGAYNQALMDLGATVCLPGGAPLCSECPLRGLCAARALGVQLVIARRDHKAFEGSVVTINYISGSGGEMKTMSLAKRAVRPGQKALIVDDFTKDGGTVRGMVELMQEFDVTTVGVGVMVERRREGAPRIYEDIRSLFIVSDAMDARQGAVVHPAPWLEVQE